MANEKHKQILETMRKRFKVMLEADQTNRREALDDMKFINEPGNQWDANMKKERGDRPCYEFNKLRQAMKAIINEMRANRPQGKVRAVEGGDKKTADIIEGLCRNIWNISDADTVVDYAAEYQVSGGYGAWRVVTEYTTDTIFEQDIKIKEIQNPFCLFGDPSAKDMLKRDGRDWILTEKIPTEVYEKTYPKAEVVEFEAHEFDDDDEWQSDEEVRVAEYWYKEPVTKEIWQLEDGKVIDSETDEAQAILATTPDAIKKRREVQTNKIMMVLASGDAILQGPIEWAGTIFPFVQVFGEYILIDGKVRWYGAGRWGKDAQRSYNVSRTSITETIAQQPQSKYWATVKQAEGNLDNWAVAHRENFPVLLYNPDPQAPGAPQRMGSADVPIALIQESQIASDEISMVTGIYRNDVGAPNQANSGRQELVRNQQGAIATFNYQDNMAKGHKLTYDILLDLIPKVYDTEREMRILGSDGAEDYVKINTFAQGPNGPIKINDLSMGRYDTTITVGPSFSTRRQEAAETYQMLLQGNPDLFPVVGDLIFKAMDLPYSDDIAERLQVMLPPQIQEMLNQDKEIPPEVQQMMQRAKQAMQMVEEKAQEVQMQAQELQSEAQQNVAAKAAVEKLISNLEVKQANFERDIEKNLANVMKKEVLLDVRENEDAIREETQKAVDTFNNQLVEDIALMMASIHKAASQLDGHEKTIVEMSKKPKIKEIKAVRKNGELTAVPVYDEDGDAD